MNAKTDDKQMDDLQYNVPEASTVGAISLRKESVLFHGVNKSGSWAMAGVLLEAYKHDRRQEEYMCRYFGMPKGRDEAIDRFAKMRGGAQLLIDHDLIGESNLFPDAKYLTLLRDPVRRLVSCYYWLRDRHPEAIKSRDLLQWARESGKVYSLCFQFACNANSGKQEKLEVKKLSPEEIAVKGRIWFEKNVCAFGITEYFEESIMWFASHLGLGEVPLWVPDKRNTMRPKWDQLEPEILYELERILEFDIEFYATMKKRFLADTQILRNNKIVTEYKNRCADLRANQEGYGAEASMATNSYLSIDDTLMQIEDIERLVSDRLTAAGLGRDQVNQTGKCQLVTKGLPDWWHEGKNKLYVDPLISLDNVPVITYPRNRKPPKNTLVISLGKSIPALNIWGDSGTIYISNGVSLPQSSIACGDGATIYLGEKTRSTAGVKLDARNGGIIYLEGDCLLGGGCRLMTDDMHTILDLETGKRINPFGGQIYIRRHVWLGLEVIVFGGATIESNSIIGARSIVSDHIPYGSIAVGVPIRVIKKNVTWDHRDLTPDTN